LRHRSCRAGDRRLIYVMAGRDRAPRGSRDREAKRQRSRVEKIFNKLDRAHADAKLALDFTSPLELLIALILAAQCTDAKVNEVTRTLFARFRSAADYAAVSQEDL